MILTLIADSVHSLTFQNDRSYLHGIAERQVDTATHLAQVANAKLLADAPLRATVEKAKGLDSDATSDKAGETNDAASLKRDTRMSLTFRDVEKVSKGVAAMMAYLQGGKH